MPILRIISIAELCLFQGKPVYLFNITEITNCKLQKGFIICVENTPVKKEQLQIISDFLESHWN